VFNGAKRIVCYKLLIAFFVCFFVFLNVCRYFSLSYFSRLSCIYTLIIISWFHCLSIIANNVVVVVYITSVDKGTVNV